MKIISVYGAKVGTIICCDTWIVFDGSDTWIVFEWYETWKCDRNIMSMIYFIVDLFYGDETNDYEGDDHGRIQKKKL